MCLAKWQPTRFGGNRNDRRQDRRPMNRIERLLGLKGEARVKYLDGEFQVLIPGDFVHCAVSGQEIALADLRYWSVALQEPYASAALSLQRYRQLHKSDSEAG